MSQHNIVANNTFVQVGFDTPMQWFYMIVSEGDELLYSNLYEAEPENVELNYLIEKAKEFGVEIPQDIINLVLEDRLLGRMNHVTNTSL